ncbi:Serine/threonine-protein kinase ATG1 [Smittium culicis]|uniref:Serine/threonine-protein kinase ATG1 n=1 Tax=Smittium culicis TaxID=133412 RepID=A0A1R1YKZ6_9FUNG|nr:Serine/threonine-protein kinase ATG1 [Smittium culicis]
MFNPSNSSPLQRSSNSGFYSNQTTQDTCLQSESIPSSQPSDWSGGRGLKMSEHALAEKEYVVVEKRAVEVNVLADELQLSPKKPSILKSASDSNNVRSQVLNQLTSLANAIKSSVPSYVINDEYKNNIGQPYDSPVYNPVDSRSNLSQKDSKSSFSFLDSNLHSMFSLKSEFPHEESVIRQMESLAYKAHAVAWFADMKVSNLLTFDENPHQKYPATDVSDNKQELLVLLMGSNVDISNSDSFALYLKALSLLHKAAACAKQFWNIGNNQSNDSINRAETAINNSSKPPSKKNSNGAISHNSTGTAGSYPESFSVVSSQKSGYSSDIAPKVASVAFSNAVQWVRNKFNDCLEKADYIKSISLPNEIGSSTVSVEKILYAKALDLSRAAALKELNWEMPYECERAYQLSIWMLSAILEPVANDPEISSEDRQIVEDFISVVVKRLESLRERLMTYS